MIKDIDDIIFYVSNDLKNKTAARNLANNFIRDANSILEFQYGLSVYKTSKKLEQEYRGFKIKNMIMFYTVNEREKIITIVRVLLYIKKLNMHVL